MKKIKIIDIVAREWVDRVNGNSYFSAFVTVNFGMPSEANFYLPFQYGYGTQYETEVRKVLVKHGYLKNLRNHSCYALSRLCRDNGIILRSRKIENCKKAELQDN